MFIWLLWKEKLGIGIGIGIKQSQQCFSILDVFKASISLGFVIKINIENKSKILFLIIPSPFNTPRNNHSLWNLIYNLSDIFLCTYIYFYMLQIYIYTPWPAVHSFPIYYGYPSISFCVNQPHSFLQPHNSIVWICNTFGQTRGHLNGFLIYTSFRSCQGYTGRANFWKQLLD